MPTLFDAAHLQAIAKHQSQQPQQQEAPQAQDHEALWPYLMLLGGQGMDAATSLTALRDPRFHETNALGKNGMLAAKAAIVPAMMWAMHQQHKDGHDGLQKVIGTIGGMLGLAPAMWNVSQMRKVK